MSVRWMAVQYLGNTLRLPIANESDMEKPFGSSVLERPIERIVVNPFSDNPQTFVPESVEATPGREECHIVKTWTNTNYAGYWDYQCSECGYPIEVWERDIATGDPTSHANFCCNCGRKVVSA